MAASAAQTEVSSPVSPRASIETANGVWSVPDPVVPWMWQRRQGGQPWSGVVLGFVQMAGEGTDPWPPTQPPRSGRALGLKQK